jgi:hypothetical protein
MRPIYTRRDSRQDKRLEYRISPNIDISLLIGSLALSKRIKQDNFTEFGSQNVDRETTVSRKKKESVFIYSETCKRRNLNKAEICSM